MAKFAVDVPEHDRVCGWRPIDTELVDTLLYVLVHGAGLGHAGNVALDVGKKHRNTELREAFRHDHEADGLAGTGRAGHHAVTVCVAGVQPDRLVALANQDLVHADSSENRWTREKPDCSRRARAWFAAGCPARVT